MKLNHKILGEGEPLVIMHGLFGMLDNWMSFAKKISESYQVILVDHRNHGRSPHSDEISFDLYKEDLRNLLNDLDIEKAHVMGHSMGGKTVMNFAVAYPNRTKSMISVDMGAHAYTKGNHDEIFGAILPLDLAQYSKRSDVDAALAEKISDFGIRQFLLKNLSRSGDTFVWKANFRALKKNYDELRKAVPSNTPYVGKCLFVRGGSSSYIRDKDFKSINEVFPNAQIETIEGAGHWVHAAKPQELLKVVKGFLE